MRFAGRELCKDFYVFRVASNMWRTSTWIVLLKTDYGYLADIDRYHMTALIPNPIRYPGCSFTLLNNFTYKFSPNIFARQPTFHIGPNDWLDGITVEEVVDLSVVLHQARHAPPHPEMFANVCPRFNWNTDSLRAVLKVIGNDNRKTLVPILLWQGLQRMIEQTPRWRKSFRKSIIIFNNQYAGLQQVLVNLLNKDVASIIIQYVLYIL